MCTELLPPGGYPIAVNKIYISYHIIYHIIPYHIICHISYHIICPSVDTNVDCDSIYKVHTTIVLAIDGSYMKMKLMCRLVGLLTLRSAG
jgi:hypothetical protein